MKGRGVPAGKTSTTGDLLVTVEVAVPDELTDEQRAAVEALAEVRRPAGRERRWECDMMATMAAERRAVYVISVAAELAGVHPQTLRVYERKGLLDPSRTDGGSRRFSDDDLDRLRRIQSSPTPGSTSRASAGCSSSRPRWPASAASSTAARAEAREAVAVTHRQYRRELVPAVPDAGARPGRPAVRCTSDEEERR